MRKCFAVFSLLTVIGLTAVSAHAADVSIGEFTHQNIVGSQTCYSGEDLEEKTVSVVPDVYFGMRINRPVFRVYLNVSAASPESVKIRVEQYNEKGKLLKTDESVVDATSGTNEYNIEFEHVRNTKYIKVYADNEYIGGLDDTPKPFTLTEYPADYEIYQRGDDNKATVTFAGKIDGTVETGGVYVGSDGTVRLGVENGTLFAAKYENGLLTSVQAVDVKEGTAKISDPEIGMKLMVWDMDNNSKPVMGSTIITGFDKYEGYSPVYVTVNGEVYSAFPDENGEFELDIEMDPGLYDASITYNGEIKREFKQFGVGDIWVAAGQSNMTDMGAITSGFDYEAEDTIPDDVHIIYPEDVTWQKMTHPAGEGRFFKSGIRTSPVTSFARELNKELGVPIGIVQSSVGGTNIFQWAEGVKPGDGNDGYLGKAMKACFDNKESREISGIIWYQGCNDAINENYAYNYEKLCDTIFGQMREFFGENTPIITTQLNDANQDSTSSLGYYDAWSYVKDVQRQYPMTHDNVYVVGTGAYDLGDTIHNSAKSNLSIGNSWAKMALNKVYGMNNIVCEHPTIDKAEITDTNEITLTFKNVGNEGLYIRTDNKYLAITNGMVTIPLGDLKQEFTVRMGGDKELTSSNKGKGTTVEIVSAQLVGNDTVVLKTADELNGNVAVDCCYGKRFVPSLTDKATGWSVLAFYNVMAEYPDVAEPALPVEYKATDTAYIFDGVSEPSDTKMYLNCYKNANAYAVMKFDISNAVKDKSHIESAKLKIYTNSIEKDRTGTVTISEIDTNWDNTNVYDTFSFTPEKTILSRETNTAGMFPVGKYSDIDITDFVIGADDEFGIGISCDHAAVCEMAGVNTDYTPVISVQYGSIVKFAFVDENGNKVPNIEFEVEGRRSTQYSEQRFVTNENGEAYVVLKNGQYAVSVDKGAYNEYYEIIEVGEQDMIKNITLGKNDQIPDKIIITGGETEVRETQGEKTLEPFNAVLYDESGMIIDGAAWEWTVTPQIMAVVDNGVVTINSHASAGSELTVTAYATINGKTVSESVKILITEAGDIKYAFDKFEISKNFDIKDASGITVGDDGILANVTASSNYANIAVMSNGDKSNGTGYYPYGTGFITSGYYMFLGAGGNNDKAVFDLYLPEIAPSGKYLNIKYAKLYSTNDGVKNRTASALGTNKTITIGSTVIDVEKECDYDKWYTKSIQLDSGTDMIRVQLGKWAGLAIEYISITAEPETEDIIIPEGVDGLNLMCVGDSITEGFTVDGAYRNRLCELIEADGLDEVVDFVGARSNGTGYDRDHSGYSGYAIADIPASDDCEGKGRNGIIDEIDKNAGTNKIDIVLLQIGTNDILSLYKLDESKTRLENLVNKLETKLSGSGKIYLATIPYINENAKYNATGKNQEELNVLIDAFNNGVKEIAASHDRVELADINSLLEFSDLQDGIHPNSSGYNKMGDFWYSTIKDFIVELISER